MCSYLLNDQDEEILDCFDPTSNHGNFYATGCYDNADVEDEMGHKQKGKFCVCDGERKNLCNEDYMKHSPDNGAATYLVSTLGVAISVFIFSSL